MFLGDFLEEVDLSLEEVGEKMQKNPFRLLPKMIYISARTESEINGEDFDLALKDVVELIESDGGISSPEVTRFVNEWTKSLTIGVPTSPAEEGKGEKKK